MSAPVRGRPRLRWLAPLTALIAVVAGGCNNDPVPQPCTGIPAGGCPVDHGADVCVDPTCSAVYACENAAWVLTRKCPPRAVEAGVEAGADAAGDGPPDGSLADGSDAGFDAPPGAYGGPNCVDLQTPDCSVGTALACQGSPGCCGCNDLYVCDSSGWVLWGSCAADGGITKSP